MPFNHKQDTSSPAIGLVLLCLVAMAGLVVLADTGGNPASSGNDRNLPTLHAEIKAVRHAIDRLTAQGEVPDQVTLAAAGSLRPQMRAGGDLRHSFGGTITVWGNRQSYWLTLHDIPSWACQALIAGNNAPHGYWLTGVSYSDGNQAVFPGLVPIDGGGLCQPQGHARMNISWQFPL